MDEALKKKLSKDRYLVLSPMSTLPNNIDAIDDIMPDLVANIIAVDKTGQFAVSAARYLFAIDPVKYDQEIHVLAEVALARDREHVYLGGLAATLWGSDYKEKAAQLSGSDDLFRRIYKRLYPATGI